MLFKFSYLKSNFILSLAVLILALGLTASANVTSGLFTKEELYSINNFTEINSPLIFSSSANAKIEAELSANHWVPDLPDLPSVEKPKENAKEISKKFDARNLKIEILSSNPQLEKFEINNCKALIENTLSVLPEHLTASLDSMKLFFAKRNPRGLSNSHLIELRCGSLSEAEIVSVFVHELGHIVDLGYIQGRSSTPSSFNNGKLKIPADDPSVRFYELSWKDKKTQKYSAERKDFVSGYAMSDVFEDFSESFNFYVLHGEDFRAIKNESRILAQKYDFLKEEIFQGLEFESKRSTKDNKRVWDSTLVEFDLTKFFAKK
jgi:hypothetical protein